MMRQMEGRKKADKESRFGDLYLYNLAQAQFFLDNGLCPVAIGRGSRGDVFLKFKRNKATEEVFENSNTYVQALKEERMIDDDRTNAERHR